MPRGTRCAAHRHENVVAEERHHLQPLSRSGLTIAANMRWLCANAHSDAHYLLDLIEDHAVPLIGRPAERLQPYEAIPWDIRRTYGPGVRDAALTGWLRYADDFLAGHYLRHRALWRTNGEPRAGAGRCLTVDSADPSPPVTSYAAALLSGRTNYLLNRVRVRTFHRGHP